MSPPLPPERDGLPDGLLERLLDCLKALEDRRVTSGPLLRSLIRIAHMDQALDTANQKLASRRLTVLEDLTKTGSALPQGLRAGFDEVSDEAKAEIRLLPSWSGHESVCSFFDDIIAASADLSRPKAAAGRPLQQFAACEQFVALLYAGQCDGALACID